MNKEVKLLRPFTRCLMTIGQLPNSYLVAMTYEEQLIWFCNFLEKEVIPTVNNNAEAVIEIQNLFTQLKNYVDNYFDNLDVQEEINNKLDEMADEGILQEIISVYLNSIAIFGYDNIENMKAAENLTDGSFARTIGYYQANDGGGALYKIRNKTNEDVIDNGSIIEINEELVAEQIFDSFINVLTFGLIEGNDSENASTNDTIFRKIITFAENNYEKHGNIYFPAGIFCLSSGYEFTKNISLYGVQSNSQAENVNSIAYKGGTVIKDCSSETNPNDFITYYKQEDRIWGSTIENINFISVNRSFHKCLNLISWGWDGKINNVSINQFYGGAIYFNDCYDTSITNLTTLDSDGVKDENIYYCITLDDTISESDRTNALHFTNCHFEISKHFLKINKARENCFTNCKFEIDNRTDDDEASLIHITSNAQDTQFIGCSFVVKGKNTSHPDIPYYFNIESTNSLRNTMISNCEFIAPSFAYKLIKSIGGTIINSCSFQILGGDNYPIYLDGSCILTNNYIRCTDNQTASSITKNIYLKNSIMSNNLIEYAPSNNTITDSQCVSFEGERTVISNNMISDTYKKPYNFIGTKNNLTKLERSGAITLTDTDILNLYGIDISTAEAPVTIPLDLNDVKGKKYISFNCSKNVKITDIKNAVGQDSIIIGNASGNQVRFTNTSTTLGTRVFTPGVDVVIFGTQNCNLEFYDYYWRTGYYSTLHS